MKHTVHVHVHIGLYIHVLYNALSVCLEDTVMLQITKIPGITKQTYKLKNNVHVHVHCICIRGPYIHVQFAIANVPYIENMKGMKQKEHKVNSSGTLLNQYTCTCTCM